MLGGKKIYFFFLSKKINESLPCLAQKDFQGQEFQLNYPDELTTTRAPWMPGKVPAPRSCGCTSVSEATKRNVGSAAGGDTGNRGATSWIVMARLRSRSLCSQLVLLSTVPSANPKKSQKGTFLPLGFVSRSPLPFTDALAPSRTLLFLLHCFWQYQHMYLLPKPNTDVTLERQYVNNVIGETEILITTSNLEIKK